MGIVPYRISRLSQIRGLLWEHIMLVILGVMFSLLIITNSFWIAVLLPYGVITWAITAQLFYWWASPLWRIRYPRVTRSMLKGEIADLKYKLSRKKLVVKQYSKTVMSLLEEVKRLKREALKQQNTVASTGY